MSPSGPRQSFSAVTLAIALLSQETGHTECAPTAGVNLQVHLSTQRARSGVSGATTKPVRPEAETKDGRGAGLLPEQGDRTALGMGKGPCLP